MHFNQIILYSVLISASIIFAHFLDNVRNRRTENSKYYYKRGLIITLIVAVVTFILSTNLVSSKGTSSISKGMIGNGVYGIQTGSAPF